MQQTRRQLAVGAVLASALIMTACLASPIASPGSPTLTARPEAAQPEFSVTGSPTAPASPDQTAGALIDCAGAETRISEPGRQFRLTGTCPLVTIEGADLEVRLVDAAVGAVVIRGDRIELDAGDIGSLSISGQDNAADAGSISALDIRGDRNEVEVVGSLAAVSIGGNDNEVAADSVDSVVVQGGGNDVRSR